MHATIIAALLLTCLLALGVSTERGPTAAAAPEQTQTGFLDRTIEVAGKTLRYVVYVPPGYDPAKRWPTIMFLHGHGECGSDGLKQVGQGIGRAVMNNRDRWPFIVIFPQKPEFDKQWEEFDAYVMATLAATDKEFSTDPTRTYLTGLSQGGHGTWMLGAAHSQRWAALVPICGYGEPDAIAPKVKGLPIRCYHGGADSVVKPEQSRRIVDALKALGAAPEYTEYEGVNHNSWDRAYAEPELPTWLLSKTKKAD